MLGLCRGVVVLFYIVGRLPMVSSLMIFAGCKVIMERLNLASMTVWQNIPRIVFGAFLVVIVVGK
jgi:hypothetical protein